MMHHSDEFEDRHPPTTRPRGRAPLWVGPALGAMLGLVLGTIVVSLVTAYSPEGLDWFSGAEITLQLAGALMGGLAGALLTTRR